MPGSASANQSSSSPTTTFICPVPSPTRPEASPNQTAANWLNTRKKTAAAKDQMTSFYPFFARRAAQISSAPQTRQTGASSAGSR